MSDDRRRTLRIAFVGGTRFARRVAGLVAARNDNIAMAAIATRRTPASDRDLPKQAGCRILSL
jgi:hypothetical protein